MKKKMNSSNVATFDLNSIQKGLKDMEELLIQNDVYNDPNFQKWLADFTNIFSRKDVDIHLYSTLSLLYFAGHLFLSKFCFKIEERIDFQNIELSVFKDMQDQVKNQFPNVSIFEFDYFEPIFKVSEKLKINKYFSLIANLCNHAFDHVSRPEFFFDFLFQKVISPVLRHKAGQFYTPPFLVKKMIDQAYEFGEKVIDPCCGSGNFLIEILHVIISSNKRKSAKIDAINNIHGQDINPISIFMSKLNFLYLLKDLSCSLSFNLFVNDSLFSKEISLLEKFDLIIGNPPWYTLRDIDSIENQDKIKQLASVLEIKPLPKNVLNIEISSLFFYQAKQLYMKKNAKIFFVMTKGVITGSHASRFRNFFGFKNVYIWTFKKNIEKVFNIDYICLFAQKSEKKLKNEISEIPNYLFKARIEKAPIDYYDSFELILERFEILMPYFVEKKGNRTYTKKLITKQSHGELLPNQASYYKDLFHKGADLNPRNLIFVTSEKYRNSLVKINPDIKIFKQAKKPWVRKEFQDELIESKYIFKVIKSTEIVKFCVYDHYLVFLPLSKDDLSFTYDKLTLHAKKFYDKINNKYINLKKDTTKHNSLMENLNRWGKLINQRQLSRIKVVYNNSGSILNSAVIQGNFLVTGDLSFHDTDNLEEAYYLTAVLNSPILTKQIQIKKSSRHIFKIPFESPIQKFDISNQNHRKLSELGRKCSLIAQSTVKMIFKKNTKRPSKNQIQKTINDKLNAVLLEIDKYLKEEFKNN